MGLGRYRSLNESIHGLTYTNSALALFELVSLHSGVVMGHVAVEMINSHRSYIETMAIPPVYTFNLVSTSMEMRHDLHILALVWPHVRRLV